MTAGHAHTRSSDHAAPRLFLTHELDGGVEIEVDTDRAHYLLNVLRLRAEDAVRLFNGHDGEWRARIAVTARRRATLRVESRLRQQAPESDLWLLLAPIKRTRIDIVAEKATELGVSVLQPVATERMAVERVNLARLQTIVTEAAEQCERLTVPEVRDPVSLGKLLAGWPPQRRLLLCAEAGGAQPIADTLLVYANEGESETRWAVMIGPEGGFASSELDALGKLPFVIPVGLGPRILRADTAALAALACWQAILGDGQQRPPLRRSA
jgi:16S rRNA (uracil1498-N3)-methyltransferase